LNTMNEMRNFMKCNFDELDNIETDQQKSLPQPPLEKPYAKDGRIVKLPEFDETILAKNNLLECFTNRASHRSYTNEKLSLQELSFLLWATQGVKTIKGDNYATIRPVPSGGARHAFETYIYVNNVDGLNKGLYRYLALSHELLFMKEVENAEEVINKSVEDQKFTSKSAVVFYWSCIPYRGEWRYHVGAHKVMLLDAGHVGQNLYLAAEAIGCGTCAIAAYNQKVCDSLLEIDGVDEFTIYVSPVGKI
jgi:SagB-type dehydrogenase family enzyme